jgi:hypothetical protein
MHRNISIGLSNEKILLISMVLNWRPELIEAARKLIAEL